MAGMTHDVHTLHLVVPAKAGTHLHFVKIKMDPGFRRDDEMVESIAS
jgi:hypothetical protein